MQRGFFLSEHWEYRFGAFKTVFAVFV